MGKVIQGKFKRKPIYDRKEVRLNVGFAMFNTYRAAKAAGEPDSQKLVHKMARRMASAFIKTLKPGDIFDEEEAQNFMLSMLHDFINDPEILAVARGE
jgi:hypothetical protein